MKRTGVIINPNAKKIRTGKNTIETYLNYQSENVFVNMPVNINELHEVAKKYKSSKVDYICIGGGDGTLHIVLSALINTYHPDPVPPLLILKEGTMNNVARSIKSKGKGHILLKRLLNKINSSKPVETTERSTIKIEDKYCFLFGTGFVTNFLDKVYAGKEKGLLINLKVALKSIKETLLNIQEGGIFQLVEQAIFVDDKKVLINPVSGMLAGTVEHIGMGFSPLIEAARQNDKFQVIVLGMYPRGILRNLNKLKNGKRIKSPKYFNVHGQSILMKQKGTFNYTMDGDIYTAKDKLKVSIGPRITLVKI